METKQTFWKTAGRILNSGQTRSLLLDGNVHDLFPLKQGGRIEQYAPVIDVLVDKWSISDLILVVYELNGPIRFVKAGDRTKVKNYWLKWRTGLDTDGLAIRKMLAPSKTQADIELLGQNFDDNLHQAIGNPTVALEVLRQMCMCSRMTMERPYATPLSAARSSPRATLDQVPVPSG